MVLLGVAEVDVEVEGPAQFKQSATNPPTCSSMAGGIS